MIAEGPFGAFTAAARRRERVALIAGGAGITPIRALLEELTGDVVVVYRAQRDEDVLLRDELEALGADVHYVSASRWTASACSRSCPTSPSATCTCAARPR